MVRMGDKRINFNIDEATDQDLQHQLIDDDLTKSQLLRACIDAYLTAPEDFLNVLQNKSQYIVQPNNETED